MDEVRIEIVDNGFSAFATRQVERPLSPRELAQIVKKNNIGYGFLKENIRRLLIEPAGTRIQIAAGKKCLINDPEAVFLYEGLNKRLHISNIVNRQDVTLLDPKYNIVKGQVIAHILVPPHKISINVFGQHVMAPLPNSPLPPLAGTHVAATKDGLQLLAEKSGVLVFHDNKIHIIDEIIIEDSVDNSYSAITSTANVRIKGDVSGRFFIYTKGNLHIEGNIEMTSLEVEGNLKIEGGIGGMNDSVIRVGGELHCSYIQQASVYARNINVQTGIMKSEIFAKECCYVNGKIIGGKVFSKDVVAQEIGNNRRIETEIYITKEPLLPNSYMQAKRICQQKKHYLKTRKKNVLFLISKLGLDDLPTDVSHQQLLFALQQKQKLAETDKDAAHWWDELAHELYKLIIVDDEILEWEKMFEQLYTEYKSIDGTISAQKYYPNVHIFMGWTEKFLENELEAVKFYLENGQIQQK